MPTNVDRYAVGNRWHCPQPKRRNLARNLARIMGVLVFLAMMAAALVILNG